MRTFPLVLLLACTATAVSAQSLRPFTTFKQRHGEEAITAQIEFRGDRFRFAPGKPNELYRMALTYDPTEYAPLSTFDTAANAWRIGVTDAKRKASDEPRVLFNISFDDSSDRSEKQAATVALSPDVDAALGFELSAEDVNLELGGLRLSSLNLKSSGGETLVQFSTPNPTVCGEASVSGGIGRLSLMNLGNSRCQAIHFQGGVGEMLLDFGGSWTSNMNVNATAAVGAVTLRLPRDLGVRVVVKKFLAGWEPNGLIRRGDAFVSANYDRAPYKLHINLTTTLGAAAVEWIGD